MSVRNWSGARAGEAKSRRGLLRGAALSAVALLGAACGATSGGDGEATGASPELGPLSLWWWNEQDLLKETEDEIMRDWPSRFPRVTLQPVKVPYAQMAVKMVTSLAADDVPDVSFTHQDWVAPFAQKQVFRPLDDLARKDSALKLPDYYPAALDFHRWKGKLYGLTWLMEGSTLFYNKNLLEKAGLADPRELDRRGQWTLERFRDYLPRLSGGSADQRTWGWNQGVTGKLSNWVDSIWQFGGEAFSADGLKLTLHQPASVEALEWRVGHYKSRITVAGDPEGAGVAMNSGRLGFLRANRLHTFDLDPNGRWGQVLLPLGKNGQRWHRAGCSAHGIVARSKQEGASWELVKYLSRQGNRFAMLRNNANPLWPAVAGGKEYAASMRSWEDAESFIQLGKQIRVMQPPPGPLSGEAVAGWLGYVAIDAWMKRVIAGEVGVRDGMEQAARECDQIVAEAMR
ncbi:MAG TPA: extracellular solute-binding protein [Chloroflexota bacterium]|nr:extracellular solute-binding protein [Chloroflexota bacterium]